MKRGLSLPILIVTGLFLPAPGPARITFQAIAGLDSWPATCLPGFLTYQGTHFGSIFSLSEQDIGRQWFIEGEGGRCTLFGIAAAETCTESHFATPNAYSFCQGSFEVRCTDTKEYGAHTTVFAFPGTNEVAHDSFPCEPVEC